MQDWPALHYWRAEQLSPFSNQDEMGAFHQIATAQGDGGFDGQPNHSF
jgi:hypothetical protein